MPIAELKIVPNVDVESTAAKTELGIQDSQYIRVRRDMVEKRGGWTKYVSASFPGGVKAIHAWGDNEGDRHLAIATPQALQVYNPDDTTDQIKDITAQVIRRNRNPAIASNFETTSGSTDVVITDSGYTLNTYDTITINNHIAIGGIVLYGSYAVTESAANVFHITAASAATSSATTGAVASLAATTGSTKVTVTLANHGYSAGQYFPLTFPVTVGGIPLLRGQYTITYVTSADSFTILGKFAATSNETVSLNNGFASLYYYVAGAPPADNYGYGGPVTIETTPAGYGSQGYGGKPKQPIAEGSTGADITATDYWLENWGDVLLSLVVDTNYGSTVIDGGLYWWSGDTGFQNAVLVPNAPLANKGMILVEPTQQVMLWGSTYNGFSDPLQIRWSDTGDYSVWQPQAINQAGGYHVATGSKIVRIIDAAQQILVFTDIDLYAGQYVGPPTVWGFTHLASGCGLIAPHAVGILATETFWMSQKNFYIKGVGGAAQILPCSAWDSVFQNLNEDYVDGIQCATNAQFHEVMWFYPSLNSTINDRYVCYNALYKTWDIGEIDRVAWIDQSVLGPPIGVSSSGIVYQHETSHDADGSAINASLTTGYAVLSEAQDFMFVDLVWPDFQWDFYQQTDPITVKFTFKTRTLLTDTPVVHGPYTVYGPNGPESPTQYIPVRFRARYVQVIIESDDLGSWWRTGKIRFRVAPDGRR